MYPAECCADRAAFFLLVFITTAHILTQGRLTNSHADWMRSDHLPVADSEQITSTYGAMLDHAAAVKAVTPPLGMAFRFLSCSRNACKAAYGSGLSSFTVRL